MGHSEINAALDVYAHADWDNFRADVDIVENTKIEQDIWSWHNVENSLAKMGKGIWIYQEFY